MAAFEADNQALVGSPSSAALDSTPPSSPSAHAVELLALAVALAEAQSVPAVAQALIAGASGALGARSVEVWLTPREVGSLELIAAQGLENPLTPECATFVANAIRGGELRWVEA